MKYIPFIALAALPALSASCGGSETPKPAAESEDMTQKSWVEIAPREIKGNPICLFEDEWFALAAGNSEDMNLMTIAWGSLGELWNKCVVTVYVSPSRYTNQYMEQNDYFTITHFPASKRQKLQYLGTVSGRDEDKVAGAGLTVEYTELGNPIFAESDLAIECRKLYAEPFKAELLPLEQRQWYDERGIGIHVAYVGEIVHVWSKRPEETSK